MVKVHLSILSPLTCDNVLQIIFEALDKSKGKKHRQNDDKNGA